MLTAHKRNVDYASKFMFCGMSEIMMPQSSMRQQTTQRMPEINWVIARFVSTV